MSKFDDKVELYVKKANELNLGLSDDLISKAAKALGPSIYNKDSETVSCSQESELNTVINSFLKGKLGLKESDEKLKEAVMEVCEKMGKSNPNKHRALFYALLAKKFGKESVYNA